MRLCARRISVVIPKEISAELDACLRSPGFRRDSKGGGGFYPKYLHSITLFVSLISGIGHFPLREAQGG